MAKKANASIVISSDTKSAEKGLKKVSKEIESFGKKTKSLGSLSKDLSAIGMVFNGAISAIKTCNAVINDLTDAYKVQANAETLLETAARNNPYLNGANVTNLKNYASQLQSISVYGDEQLLPMMAQLAAAGRTEEQIMKIMSASIDVAASGAMSLDSAVKNLNKTFAGNAGELGEAIPAIRNLTKELLSNGEAVKIVAEQYNGMAEETARATGSAQQLSNAWGDLKEHLGEGLEKAVAPIRRALTSLITSINDTIGGIKQARKEAKELKDILDGKTEGKDSSAFDTAAKALEARRNEAAEFYKASLGRAAESWAPGMSTSTARLQILDAFKTKSYEELTKAGASVDLLEAKQWYDQFQEYERQLSDVRAEYSKKYQQEQEKEKQKALDARKAEIDAAVDAANKQIEKEQRKIELEERSGKAIAESEKNQRLYNAAYAAYLEMLEKDANPDELEQSEGARDIYERMRKWQQGAGGGAAKAGKAAKVPATWEQQVAELSRSIEAVQAEIDRRREVEGGGDEVSELESILKKYQDGFVKLLTENPDKDWEKEIHGSLEELYGKMEETAERLADAKGGIKAKEDVESFLRSVEKAIEDSAEKEEKKLSEILEEQKRMLNEQAQELIADKNVQADDRIKIEERVRDATIAIDRQITEARRKEAEEQKTIDKAAWQERIQTGQQFASQLGELLGTLSEINRKAAEADRQAELAELEKKHEEGLLSDEEYAQKKLDIERDAARQQYKSDLWQWTKNCASIVAQTAKAVVSALSSAGNPILGIALAGIVGSIGAAQLGVALAQKPKPPSFATGGIVPGNSWTGDKVQANVNSGEMILTRAQQADLWNTLNGKGEGGGYNVSVNNYMGGRAKVNTKQEKGGLTIEVLDQHINLQMARGGYETGFSGREVAQKGTVVL